MPLPATTDARRRPLMLGITLVALLFVPTILGFTVAAAGESQPPTAEEDAAGPIGTRVLREQDQEALVSGAPLANAPSSVEDALTRQSGGDLGFPRLQFRSDATGELRVDDGGTVALPDGYAVTVHVSPFPPTSFDVDVMIEITKDGVPITDATIDTVWDMSVMTHGPFTTPLATSGDGAYATSYDFFMFGPWFVDTTVTAPGAEPIQFRLWIYVWPE